MNESISASASLCVAFPICPTICLFINDLCTLLVCLWVTRLWGYEIARTIEKCVKINGKNTNFVISAKPFKVWVSCTESIYQAFTTFWIPSWHRSAKGIKVYDIFCGRALTASANAARAVSITVRSCFTCACPKMSFKNTPAWAAILIWLANLTIGCASIINDKSMNSSKHGEYY